MLKNKKELEKMNTLAKNIYYIFIEESDFTVRKTN